MGATSQVMAGSRSIQADYMKLLVTQLQHQDPLEPMDNNQMASQLAQLSSLEQLENMNGTFREVLASQERLQAMALIGRQVDFIPEGHVGALTGRVDGVNVYDEGIRLSIGEYTVNLDAVQTIRN